MENAVAGLGGGAITATINNVGVAFLDEGNLRTCSLLFVDALRSAAGVVGNNNNNNNNNRQLRQEQEQQEQQASYCCTLLSAMDCVIQHDPNDDDHHHHRQQQQQQQQQRTTTRTSNLLIASSSSSSSSQFEASLPFVHRHGIQITDELSLHCSTNEKANAIVLSIILFNMALANHRAGIEICSKRQRTEMLIKAGQLYGNCRMLLIDAVSAFYPAGNPLTDVLTLALFNNLANVNYELEAHDSAYELFIDMVHFSMAINYSKYNDVHVESVVGELTSGFLLNALILCAPIAAAAA